MPRFSYRHAARWIARSTAAGFLVAGLACGGDGPTNPPATGFLGGTTDNHEIGLVVNSTGKSLTLFQLGSPTTQKQIALGTSSTVTPTGFAVQGRRAAIPLGNAASVALIDLERQSIARYFTFPSGNATGVAFIDDTTIAVANSITAKVGRMTTGQTADAIAVTADVAPQPTAITLSNGRVLVTSANLDENYAPIDNGIVTAIDAKTFQVLGSVKTGGTNSTDAAMGPDGYLYVLNTGDYVAPGSMTIVNPATMQVVTTVTGVGVGPGAIYIDGAGLAYISGYASGTIVYDTKTRTFVRDANNPVCAKVGNACRGAFSAATSANGNVYQLFFGSAAQGLAPYAFVYRAGTFALVDSIAVGSGPASIKIRTF